MLSQLIVVVGLFRPSITGVSSAQSNANIIFTSVIRVSEHAKSPLRHAVGPVPFSDSLVSDSIIFVGHPRQDATP